MKFLNLVKPELLSHLRLATKGFFTDLLTDCLKYLIEVNTFLSNKTYWTSGFDKDGPGKYSWCNANNTPPVGDLNWKDGKVGSTAGCVTVFFPTVPRPTKLDPTARRKPITMSSICLKQNF